MSDLRKAAQMALEALEYHVEQTRPITRTSEAITVLRAALAQPEQEPVACQYAVDVSMPEYRCVKVCQYETLQRKPLTDEEIRHMKPISPDFVDFRSGVRCAERAHGIGDAL